MKEADVITLCLAINQRLLRLNTKFKSLRNLGCQDSNSQSKRAYTNLF